MLRADESVGDGMRCARPCLEEGEQVSLIKQNKQRNENKTKQEKKQQTTTTTTTTKTTQETCAVFKIVNLHFGDFSLF